MKADIETREVVTVSAGGICLRGTHHKPKSFNPDILSFPDEKIKTGVLFLNGSVEPRAAFGDAAVYWANWLASSGYRSFRFDLPGFGDSDGDLPRTESALMSLVNAGAFSDSVNQIVDQLVERFKLRNVIVFGHCSGAVTALYAAAANERIQGLILLDPYFHVKPESEIQSSLVDWHWRIIGKLVGSGSVQGYLRAVRLHSFLRSFYRRKMRLPATANLPLIQCWNKLASKGLRILVLRSPSFIPKAEEFDYLGDRQSMSDRSAHISVKVIEGATHAFAERHARETVRADAEQWLSNFPPLTRCTEIHSTPRQSPEAATTFRGVI